MRKLIQTRYTVDDGDNCLPTVIACFLDLDSPEEAIQVQEHYPREEEPPNDIKWALVLDQWLRERGWEMDVSAGHIYGGEYYLVTGESPRGTTHVCIYKDGELWHDPHPSGDGLTKELQIETLRQVGIKQ